MHLQLILQCLLQIRISAVAYQLLEGSSCVLCLLPSSTCKSLQISLVLTAPPMTLKWTQTHFVPYHSPIQVTKIIKPGHPFGLTFYRLLTQLRSPQSSSLSLNVPGLFGVHGCCFCFVHAVCLECFASRPSKKDPSSLLRSQFKYVLREVFQAGSITLTLFYFFTSISICLLMTLSKCTSNTEVKESDKAVSCQQLKVVREK